MTYRIIKNKDSSSKLLEILEYIILNPNKAYVNALYKIGIAKVVSYRYLNNLKDMGLVYREKQDNTSIVLYKLNYNKIEEYLLKRRAKIDNILYSLSRIKNEK